MRIIIITTIVIIIIIIILASYAIAVRFHPNYGFNRKNPSMWKEEFRLCACEEPHRGGFDRKMTVLFTINIRLIDEMFNERSI